MNPIIYAGLPYIDRMSYLNKSSDVIVSIVSEVTGLTVMQISSKSRKQPFVYARCYISYFLRKYTHMTLKEIGAILGGRDHSTILYSIDLFKQMHQFDKGFKEVANRIENRIKEVR